METISLNLDIEKCPHRRRQTDGWMTSSVDNLQMEPPLVQAVK